MPNLEIITIGTELLLGEIIDTNATYIARQLRDHGIDIYRITTIGDNPIRIAAAIKESLQRADIVITTGGLGPTVDDPTREAVAKATDRELIFSDQLWQQVKDQFKKYGKQPTDNNKRQAYMPKDSLPLPNPVGTAPSFIVETPSGYVISLPGVPGEMKKILNDSVIPFLKQKFTLKTQIIKASVLHVASIGESAVDELIDDLERFENPTVGLLAHPGQVDIRITAKANSEEEALRISQPVINTLIKRLGEHVYGLNEDTLFSTIENLITKNGINLILVVSGMDKTFYDRIATSFSVNVTQLDSQPEDLLDLVDKVQEIKNDSQSDIGFGLSLKHNHQSLVDLIYLGLGYNHQETRKFGGVPENFLTWAENIGLDYLRRQLITNLSDTKLENT